MRHSAFAARVARECFSRSNPNLHYARSRPIECLGEGPDLADKLLWPVFYISEALGKDPARLVKDIIAGDERFFEPVEVENYNDNLLLVEAIRNGARGAYWNILRRMRRASA